MRILKLNKWYVPKTLTLGEVEGNVAIGHFDSVEIRGKENALEGEHPFKDGYQAAKEWRINSKKELVDHSTQELMLFTNIGENDAEDGSCFSEKTIHEFWEDNSSPYLFLSMIHIKHVGKLKDSLKEIKNIFEDKYISYVSLDYCDVVVFVKQMYIKEFLGNLRKLIISDDENNTFFDSFSLITFVPTYSKMANGMITVDSKFKFGCEEDKFQATINLSIKDYKVFDKWYSYVEDKYSCVEKYHMFGRHDISIVNDEADTVFLMDMMNKLHSAEGKKAFWTFETFIKQRERMHETESERIECIDRKKDTWESEQRPNVLYQKVQINLKNIISKLERQIMKSTLVNKDSFLLPVYEIRDCICSIVKNNFAEEFVCCIYDSVQHFILYISDKVKDINEGKLEEGITEKKIADSYNKYFAALNTLVNSTMHSDRQFIQATAFNAMFYLVPPKIMAFYNAYVYRLKEILKDTNCNEEYSFLLYPSFSHFMSIEQVSLEDKPPCSRILTAKISEKAIYDISSVCYQLVHELAHNIGDEVRNREVRAKHMFHSLLMNIMDSSKIYSDDIIQLFDNYLNEIWISKESNRIYLQEFEKNSGMLLTDLMNEMNKERYIIFERCCNEQSESAFEEFFLKDFGLPQVARSSYKQLYHKEYIDYVYTKLNKQLEEMKYVSKVKLYNDDVRLLKKIYRESYADLQMMIILLVSPQDYLYMFSKNSILAMRQFFKSAEDAIRVSLVFKVMMDCGMWKKYNGDNESFKNIYSAIEKYNEKNFADAGDKYRKRWKEKIEKIYTLAESYFDEIEELEFCISADTGIYDIGDVSTWQDLRNYTYITYGLYDYLLDVMQKALIEYSTPEKKAKIRAVHTTVKTLLAADDMVEVYNCIEEEIEQYKEQLFGAES